MGWISPLPYAVLDRRIGAVLAERMEHGATDALDQQLMFLVAELKRVEEAGWFS